MIKVFQILAIYLILLLGMSSPLNASSSSSNMLVSATVASSCHLNHATLTFGTYDPAGTNANSPLRSDSTLEIRCTKNTTAAISLDTGLHAGNASGTHRAMANSAGDGYLSYDVYTNASYSDPWTSTNPVTYTAANGAPATIHVYGAVPANQDVKDGVYNDVITINATF